MGVSPFSDCFFPDCDGRNRHSFLYRKYLAPGWMRASRKYPRGGWNRRHFSFEVATARRFVSASTTFVPREMTVGLIDQHAEPSKFALCLIQQTIDQPY